MARSFQVGTAFLGHGLPGTREWVPKPETTWLFGDFQARGQKLCCLGRFAARV